MTTKERVIREEDTKRKGRGGDRGGRRPKTGRGVSVTLRISQEAKINWILFPTAQNGWMKH